MAYYKNCHKLRICHTARKGRRKARCITAYKCKNPLKGVYRKYHA